MFFIRKIVCPNFPWYSIFALWKEFPSADMIYFLYVESVLKGVSTFLFFSWKPFIYQLYDVIIIINTETKMRPVNPKL